MSGTGTSQVEQNYQAFQKLLPQLMKTNPGQYALLNNGQVIRFFQSASDAVQEGFTKYGPGNFSVQEVTDQPLIQAKV
ncbi:MAG: hypothetical protein ACREHE_14100 [Rhizomicrobium sp.]